MPWLGNKLSFCRTEETQQILDKLILLISVSLQKIFGFVVVRMFENLLDCLPFPFLWFLFGLTKDGCVLVDAFLFEITIPVRHETNHIVGLRSVRKDWNKQIRRSIQILQLIQ